MQPTSLMQLANTTEALRNFSVFRETFVSMAATNYLRSPVWIRPSILISKNLLWNYGMKCQCSSSSSSSSGVDEKSVFSLTSSSKYEVDYLGEKTKGDLNVKVEHLEAFGNFLSSPMLYFVLSVLKLQPYMCVCVCVCVKFCSFQWTHVGIDSQATLKGPMEEVARVEAEEAEDLLRDLGIPVLFFNSFSYIHLVLYMRYHISLLSYLFL